LKYLKKYQTIFVSIIVVEVLAGLEDKMQIAWMNQEGVAKVTALDLLSLMRSEVNKGYQKNSH